MPIKYWLIAVFLFSGVCEAQTCIVAKRLKDRIFIGADSREMHTTFRTNGINDTSYFTVCKIYSANGYYLAVAGHMASTIRHFLKNSFEKYPNPIEAFRDFYNASYNAIKDTLESIATVNHKEFIRLVNKDAIQIIVGHFEHDTAVLYGMGGLRISRLHFR